VNTGGVNTGGVNTGGVNTGGVNTGGVNTGGVNTDDAHADRVRADRATLAPAEREPALADVAAILCTSGTTGMPKAVMLTHANLLENVRALRAHKTWTEHEVFGNPLPVFHVYGITVMTLMPLSMGATVVRIPRVNPESCLAAIERERITRFAAVPSVFSVLNRYRGRARFDVSSCVSWISGGAPLPEAVVAEFEAGFARHIHEGYGMLESSPGISWNLDDRPFQRGAVGRPLAGVTVEIRDAGGRVLGAGDVGEVWVKSPGVMKGYYGDAETTAETVRDGWLDTGDLGCIDAGGYLYLRGRKKEVMIVAGHKVYPTEIESVLLEDPSVADAGVVAREDAARGDQVIAFVVAREGAAIDERALLERCRSSLSGFKIPRRIVGVGAIPRNKSGKILRAALLEIVAKAGPSVSA
jgi:long-chain acyl-CoA synthetase